MKRNSSQSLLFCAVVVLLFTVAACSTHPPEILGTPRSITEVARGRELFHGLAACGYCHGANGEPDSLPSGGREFFDRYGAVRAANLTPSEAGLAGWTTVDIMRAIRSSIGKNGEALSRELHKGYEWLSDLDTLGIVAYLKTLPPVNEKVERRSLGFIERNTTGMSEARREIEGYVPAINPRFEAEYGKYLLDHVARCASCHNTESGLFSEEEFLGGGQTIRNDQGEALAPAINASKENGIGSWKTDDVLNYLKTGRTPEGNTVNSAFCPVDFYANASEGDLRAVVKYLKALSPSGN